MPTNSLKILAVTSEIPWPLNSGGHLRSFYLLREISKSASLRLVVPADPSQDENVRALIEQGINVIPVPGCVRKRHTEAWKILKSIVRRESYVFYRRHYWKQVAAEIRKQIELERPDLVYFDHLDSFTYRKEIGDLPFVVDMHNVYSAISQRLANETRNPLKKAYLHHETQLIQKAEEQVAKSARSVFAVSDIEREHFRSLGATFASTIPNGVNCEQYKNNKEKPNTNSREILFVGDLSWAPNISAALFLANEVIPKVRQHSNDATLTIVGRNPVPEIQTLNNLEGVTVIPNAPEILSHYHRASVLAVPLQSGGGTRLKILEAFAASLPVVSTPVGCEGLEVVDGEHLIVSKHDEFADSLSKFVSENCLNRLQTFNALNLVEKTYDWSSVGEKLVSVLHDTPKNAP
ncbi:glycosyltransferase family 4 protein [Thalassoglobus polymorphus]|uniref:D-inositol-3-phosphate glycosyltransferase n=1 Tax=Thalassoglobus polymorphus TaxID=2527994 RepID=A0A517QSQ7_9PLAN|nr:glycosyltransferase family 4 protein [Thalassoglobus polymorphus]QDT34651.1 D-inositol-3-phosphate glycosyltransferase [Thalassoglobus polymorphus]